MINIIAKALSINLKACISLIQSGLGRLTCNNPLWIAGPVGVFGRARCTDTESGSDPVVDL